MVLIAAANCFKTHIRVISSLGHDLIISSDHPVTNSSPLVLGHIHEEHYVSLHPRLGKCKWIKFCNFIEVFSRPIILVPGTFWALVILKEKFIPNGSFFLFANKKITQRRVSYQNFRFKSSFGNPVKSLSQISSLEAEILVSNLPLYSIFFCEKKKICHFGMNFSFKEQT